MSEVEDPGTIGYYLQQIADNTTPAPQTLPQDHLRPVAAPTQGWPIYLDSAHINIETYSTVQVAGLVQFVTIRYQDLKGNIFGLIANVNAFTSSVNMNFAQLIIPIPAESFLLSVEFGGNTPATNLKRGQLYVQAYIGFDSASQVNPSNGQVQTPVIVLIQDYVFNGYNPSWPGPFKSTAPTDGAGYIFQPAFTMAAGAELLVAVPTGVRWKVHGIRPVLVTSAAIANRSAAFNIAPVVTGTIFRTAPGPTQTAGLTVEYALTQDYPLAVDTAIDANGWVRFNFPLEQPIAASGFIASTTTNLDVGDQWTVDVIVEQWIEP